ncbi:MAG: ferritin family protein [Kiritimatiellia bacterium]
MTSKRDEAVNAAIKLEDEGMSFYREAASQSKNGLSGRMFEALARDEERHKEWIQNLSSGGATASVANRELYQRLKTVFGDVPEGARLEALMSDDDNKAVEIAIGIEDRSIEAYDRWGREEEDEEVRKLCCALSGQERFHKQVLENTREYLDKTADWFMQEEQWNFEGA